jgi:hypothetical protein
LSIRHRYIKTLSEDYANARQNVTDLYNLLISPHIKRHYPEIFEKTDSKREETMASFTTATGVKMRADSVGMGRRGDIQEDSRPSLLWFEDFENRKVLRSAVTLQSIRDNMEERLGRAWPPTAAPSTTATISERGNVHRLIEKHRDHTLIRLSGRTARRPGPRRIRPRLSSASSGRRRTSQANTFRSRP